MFGVCYNVGCVLFLNGYADTNLDVSTARYRKGGALKWVGYFGSMVTAISMVGTWNGWW